MSSSFQSNAQNVPQGFKYQTSIRDNTGALLANKLVALKLSFLRTSPTGTIVYIETHNLITNDFGIANLNIGTGTPLQGTFSAIDWGNGPYFIKTELDVNNGNNYLFMGTNQLLSVPFALYAEKSANAENDFDKDSLNEIQQLELNGNQLLLSKNGGSVGLDKFIDNTDSQTISLQGNTLSISRGNSIVLSGAVDLDSDPINELQSLSVNNDTLRLSKTNYVLLPKDNDIDSLNEIQTLSVTGNRLILSKANEVNIDTDTSNEIQTLTQTGNTITLNKGGGNINAVTPGNIQNGSLLFATASGINNILLTLTPSIGQYSVGMMVNFKNPATNTSSITLNINGLGSKHLLRNVTDTLKSGDLLINQMVNVIYDGYNFQLLNPVNSNNYEFVNYTGFTIGNNNFSKIATDTNTWTSIPIDSIKAYSGNSFSRLSDTIIIKPGLYKVHGGAMFLTNSNGVMFRLFNVNDNKTEIVSPFNSLSGVIWLELDGYLNLNVEKKFLLQFISDSGTSGYIRSNTNSWGLANNYSQLIIEKVK